MSTDPRLETYLSKLERVLGPFPGSDRAEIIMEIKSHVLAAMERDPQTAMDSVLSALGEPETVANRYLMERGMKPTKPPISPIVKWLVIGFLGTVAMCLVFAGVLAFKFSPLFKVDGNTESISLLGGLIQISGDEGSIRVGNSFIRGGGQGTAFDGVWEAKGKKESFTIKFGNGQWELNNSTDPKLSWQCRGGDLKIPPQPVAEGKGMLLDMSQITGVKCELSVPEKQDVRLEGINGRIEVNEPHYDFELDLKNGKVDLAPDAKTNYRYGLSVMNGKMASFESSSEPGSFAITVHMINGVISRSH